MESKLAASLSQFAARFCNEQGWEKSSICSPLSVEVVLALTALGSSGETRAELLKAMDISDDEAIRSSFAFLTSTLKSVEGVTLKIANRVYVTKNGTLKPALARDAVEVFDSGLEQLDFKENVAAAGAINQWVAEQTNKMITNIVTPDSLAEDTAMVLVNAIFFQGFWEIPFSKIFSKNRKFHVDNNTVIKVPTMFMEDEYFRYKHSPELKAQLLQMHYEGHQASLVVVLPDKVEGLRGVLQQLASGHDLLAEIEELKKTKLDVMIPKFKVETEIDLMELLPKLGIKSIFDGKTSDIRMLTSEERLCVDKAVQKAVIEVDEAGTKAAACTWVRGRKCCKRIGPPKKREFLADRPFIYVLTARELPLFLGTYRGSEYEVLDTLDIVEPKPTGTDN